MSHSNTEIDPVFLWRGRTLCRVTAGWIICYRQESIFPGRPWPTAVPWVLRWASLVCDVKASSLAVSELHRVVSDVEKLQGLRVIWHRARERGQSDKCVHAEKADFLFPARSLRLHSLIRCSFRQHKRWAPEAVFSVWGWIPGYIEKAFKIKSVLLL